MEYQKARRGKAGSSSRRVRMMPGLCVLGLGRDAAVIDAYRNVGVMQAVWIVGRLQQA
jgi:hypothetical protein